MRIILPEIEVSDNTPTWIEIWRNGKYGYCAQLMTEDGNQVGNAEYSGTKSGAEISEREWEAQYSIDHKYSLKKRKEYRKRLKNDL